MESFDPGFAGLFSSAPPVPNACKRCRVSPCSCAADRRSAAAARAIDPSPSARLPSEAGDGRLLGGNLERHDRTPPIDQVRDLLATIDDRAWLGVYLQQQELRLLAVKTRMRGHAGRVHAEAHGHGQDEDEAAVLDQETRILHLFLDGSDLKDISAAFGRARTHTWASERMKDIRARAGERHAQRRSVATACACRRAGCIVTTLAGTGRPRRFKTDKCRRETWERSGRRRARVRRVSSVVSSGRQEASK